MNDRIVFRWIRRHQVAAFFILTFAITWGLGFSYDAVINNENFLLAPLVMIATCGPALAGILVTAVCNPQAQQPTGKAYWITFFTAWIVSALVFLANNLFINHAPLSIVMVVFTIICVLPVAFVISMARSRIPAVKRYLASLICLRGAWKWHLLALVLIPAWILLSVLISSLLDRQSLAYHRFPAAGLPLIGLIVVKFLYQLFFFNATGEEAGWRGFALPRMQAAVSPLVACLIINLFWPLWHLFLWEAEGRPVMSLAYWGQTYLELLPASLALGWLYNRSKGSILTAGIGHAAANTAFAFFPNLDWLVFVWTSAAAALVMILIDQMWKKLPHDHPAVYQYPQSDGQTGAAPVPAI
jgi:membrane protease YdiL (CAAX protease family)